MKNISKLLAVLGFGLNILIPLNSNAQTSNSIKSLMSGGDAHSKNPLIINNFIVSDEIKNWKTDT